MKVFVLASGNSKIGMGHINRSLMLVRKLSVRGVKSYYFCYDNDITVNTELEKEANLVLIENQDFNLARTYCSLINTIVSENDQVLLYIDSDHEAFYSESFQKDLIRNGVRLMYATVKNQYHFYAHLILNQNIIALSQSYSTEVYTKKLLGPKYFLWPEKAMTMKPLSTEVIKAPYSLFVNFGNADPNNLTRKIWQIIKLNKTNFSKVIIVVGNLYNGFDELNREVQAFSNPKIQLFQNPENMYDLMQSCQVGISSMGMTFWELTYLNIPTMVLSASLREQKICDYISSEKYAVKMGDFDDENWERTWTDSLAEFSKDLGGNNLKTFELKNQINIQGIELVVDEMMNVF
jgi:spore coat polysaccharide biosynthesis predicted glycosyltransferase SpsG